MEQIEFQMEKKMNLKSIGKKVISRINNNKKNLAKLQ